MNDIPGTQPPEGSKETRVKLKRQLKQMFEDWETQLLLIQFQARSTKAFFDFLINEGFTKEDALEIVKVKKII